MIVAVKFKNEGKQYFFSCDGIDLNLDDHVIVETDRGVQLGCISALDVMNENIKYDIKPILRRATKKDYDIFLNNLKEENELLIDLKKKVKKDEIPMKIIDANYTFDKKQVVINFVSDDRVDFRELVKYLAAKYKTRIELHQIGVRDKSKCIGGLGQCGLELCCKKFKNSMDGISINMAKNQSISLNPNKINGCCGRLLCCLEYENDTYSEYKKCLPKINEEIVVDNKKGKVIRVDVLKRKVYADVDGIITEVNYNDK